MNVKFKRWDCKLVVGRYYDGNVAIKLCDRKTHEPIATCTVNLPESAALPNDVAYIKNWSENEGMVDALVVAGVIDPAPLIEFTAAAGYIKKINAHRIKVEALAPTNWGI